MWHPSIARVAKLQPLAPCAEDPYDCAANFAGLGESTAEERVEKTSSRRPTASHRAASRACAQSKNPRTLEAVRRDASTNAITPLVCPGALRSPSGGNPAVSTLLYALASSRRTTGTVEPANAGPPTQSTSAAGAVSTGAVLGSLAGLVPAEVLATRALVISLVVGPLTGASAASAVTSSNALRASFWALAILSAVIYVLGILRERKWSRWDFARMCIPPLAFVAWIMLQPTTAFDAVAGWTGVGRSVTAVIGALALGLAATSLAYKVPAN